MKLLIPSLIVSLAATAQPAVQLILGNASVMEGTAGTTTLALTATTGNSPAALEFSVTYSADVTGVTVAAGTADTTANKTLACGTATPTSITCIVYGINQTLIANGPVATVAFTTVKTPASRSESLGIGNTTASSATGTVITSGGTGGTLTILSIYDLNKDGAVNSADVLLMLNEALGITSCTDKIGDGLCNVGDVMLEVLAVLGVIPT